MSETGSARAAFEPTFRSLRAILEPYAKRFVCVRS